LNIHLKIRHGLIALCCPLVLGAAPASFAQQAYPTRPVTLTVGFAPGGSTDRLARLLALGMQEELGQQVIVENRPGAAGNIAAQLVAQAAPNGYTLFMSTLSSQAINPWIYSKLGFDPIKSFEPVALVARYPLVMAVTPSLALKTQKEVVDHIRQKPGKM
jgi:tripartite-type tricarboxylate transporter receptor subunit TctC